MDYNPDVPSKAAVLTWGILGLAFSTLGILGLIFSIIGKNKAKAYAAYYGQLDGPAQVGSILGKVGFPISIVMMVFWVGYIALFASVFSHILR